MTKVQHFTNLIYRLFLLTWLLAVLWAKGYLWSIFTITSLLLLLEGYLVVNRVAANMNRPQFANARPKPGGRRSKGAEKSDETSWREPKPQWSPPPAKG
jgi:hypothetical protein